MIASNRLAALFAASVLLGACVSLPAINDTMQRIDRTWQLEYQRSEDQFRYRAIDTNYATALLAVRATFLDLGMPVQDINVDRGVIVVENEAPNPLSKEEWLAVAKAENPRLHQLAGPMFIIPDDPKGYTVTVKATVRDFRGKTLVLLDYALDSPKMRRSGIQPSKHAPPMAVQLASAKFWTNLEKRLRAVKAPAPRQRSKQEIDA